MAAGGIPDAGGGVRVVQAEDGRERVGDVIARDLPAAFAKDAGEAAAKGEESH
jgi:hypothetical protein